MHDDERSGRPSLITNDVVIAVGKKIRETQKFNITQLSI